MNIFYEINPYVSCREYLEKYWMQLNVDAQPIYMLILKSDRVWIEDEHGVRFFKNRHGSYNDPCNLKEFMWIRLQCRVYGHLSPPN